jgi:hypothetical protein
MLRGKEIKLPHLLINNFRRLLIPCISSHKFSRFSHWTMSKVCRHSKHPIPPSGNRFCWVLRH